jgi:hypothetical protein
MDLDEQFRFVVDVHADVEHEPALECVIFEWDCVRLSPCPADAW